MLGTTPTMRGTTPTMLGTTPTMLGTTPTMLGTTPTMLGTTPTMLGTTPTMLGTTPTTCSSLVVARMQCPCSDTTPPPPRNTTTDAGSMGEGAWWSRFASMTCHVVPVANKDAMEVPNMVGVASTPLWSLPSGWWG